MSNIPIPEVLSFAAAYFSLIVAVAVLFHDRKSSVHRMFAAGMALFAAEEIFRGFSAGVVEKPEDVLYWQQRVLAISAILPGIWLVFSVHYARANSQKLNVWWNWALAAICLA